MPKHIDVMIIGGVAIVALTGLLLFDRSPLAGNETSSTLLGDSSLYQQSPASSDPETATATSETPKKKSWWQTDSENSAPPNSRLQPAPFEKGVVHLGEGASLGGRRPLPDDNAWNQTIDHLPVDPLSDLIIKNIGAEKNLHPDFGAGLWKGARIGIPYIVVSGDQRPVPIRYTAYGDESDPGPYPVPPNAPIEGDPNEEGDRHVIVVDRDSWKLYELFRAFPVAGGHLWKAESGAIFDLNKHPDRPVGWTSADAAGLPIFPGLVRYDEVVEQKEIRHALRFTVAKTRRAFVPPATHYASKHTDINLPPLGMRVRLKKDVDISSYSQEVQVILTAMKKYGMILADNGSNWFVSGAPDLRWNDDHLHQLKKIKGSDLEVVLMEGLVEEGL